MLAFIFLAALASAETSLDQDTTTVRARGPGLWGPSSKLIEELRIGELEGAPEYLFGAIAGIAVGPTGAIYVADYQGPMLRMYDATGRFVRTIGRVGNGPGEYTALEGIRTLRDGRLATWDPGNQRINLYDASGNFLENYRVPSGLYSSENFAIDTAGNFYVKAHDMRKTPPCKATPGQRTCIYDGEVPGLLIKVSPNGIVIDSIALPVSGVRPSFVLQTSEGVDRPFVRETVHAWSPHGYLVVGQTERYAVNLLRPGQPVLRIERDVNLVRVTSVEKAEYEAWIGFFNRSRSTGSALELSIPSTKPAFRSLHVDEDGRVWVDRHVSAQQRPPTLRRPGDERPQHVWREPRTFDVFEPGGRFLGTIVPPRNTYLYVRRGNQAWAVQRGTSDEQYVVRFRIQPGN